MSDYVRGFGDGVKAAREVARLGMPDDTPIHPQIDPEPLPVPSTASKWDRRIVVAPDGPPSVVD